MLRASSPVSISGSSRPFPAQLQEAPGIESGTSASRADALPLSCRISFHEHLEIILCPGVNNSFKGREHNSVCRGGKSQNAAWHPLHAHTKTLTTLLVCCQGTWKEEQDFCFHVQRQLLCADLVNESRSLVLPGLTAAHQEHGKLGNDLLPA